MSTCVIDGQIGAAWAQFATNAEHRVALLLAAVVIAATAFVYVVRQYGHGKNPRAAHNPDNPFTSPFAASATATPPRVSDEQSLLATETGAGIQTAISELTSLPLRRSRTSLTALQQGGPASPSDFGNLFHLIRARSEDVDVGSLEIGALLGRGGFGKVYKGRWRGAFVAIKIIEHDMTVASKLDGLRESTLSAAVHHPNVVSTYKVATTKQQTHVAHGPHDSASDASGQKPDAGNASRPGKGKAPHDHMPEDYSDTLETWMLLEFCDRGNLDRAIRTGTFKSQDGKPNMVHICRCLIDIAAGMDYLHSLGILHGDLKGGNILLRSTSTFDDPRGFVCKIGDFGLSRILDAEAAHVTTTSYGTVSYAPAELLREGRMTRAADVYSFAMIMYELYSGQYVFQGLTSMQVCVKVLKGYRPPWPEDMPQEYRDLVAAAWHADPAQRPPFSHILKYLRKMYYGLNSGRPRDSRCSLDIDPWMTT